MSRSMNTLRRGLLGIAFVGSLGFGAAQAFGSAEQPQAAALATCPAKGYDYAYAPCAQGCAIRRGYCSAAGYCQCGDLP